MAPSGARGLLMLLPLLIDGYAFGQEIIVSPKNTTVFLNHEGMFTCEANGGDYTFWRLNGKSISDISPDIEEDLNFAHNGSGGNGLFIMNITAITMYNGTTVQCVTGDVGGMTVESENVTMTIQGLLLSVVNLETDNNTSSITVSWSAPLSLDVTGVDPDIWYSVLIYNVTDEENPTAVPCTDCHNLTQTHYIFSPDYLSPCHKYTFTVIPYNGAGQGESSQNVTGQLQPHSCPDLEKHTIQITEGGYQVTVHFKGLDDVYNSTLHILDNNKLIHSVVGSQNVFQLQQNKIHENQQYKAYVQLVFHYVRSFVDVNTSIFCLNTFDAQNATVKAETGGIYVKVEYINGTSAMGSFVIMQCQKNESDHYRPMERNEDPDVISIPYVDTGYKVLVYDLEQDGLPSTLPAITERVIFNEPYRSTDLNAPISTFLKTAELSISGSSVSISCEFADEYPEASCVLVYRKYDNPTLLLNESIVPFTIFIDDTSLENYTFAVFGKNSRNIEGEPVIVLKNEQRATYPPSETSDKDSSGHSTQEVTIGVMVAMSLILVAAGIVASIVVIIIWNAHMKRKLTFEISVPHQNDPVVQVDQNISKPVEEIEQRPIEDVNGGQEEEMKVNEESKYASVVTSSIKENHAIQYHTNDHTATKRAGHPHGLLYAELGAPPPELKLITNRIILEEPKPQYACVLPHTTDTSDSDFTAKPAESVNDGAQKMVAEQKVLVTQDTSNSDEERGIKVMMFSESVTEQHGNVLQPTIHLQNEGFIEDCFTSCNHDEMKSADNEPFSLVVCPDDDHIVDVDDKNADALALIEGTTHSLSSPFLTKSAQESSWACNSSQAKKIEPVSCTEISSDAIFVVSQSSSLLQKDADQEKASDRKLISDGSVVIPQPCTEDLSADTAANRAGVFFTYKSENHCSSEIKFTDRVVPITEISEQPQLCTKELVISPGLPFYPTDAMVTGQMYCDPKHMDCSEMEPQYVSVACPNTSEEKTPERAPLPQCQAQTVTPPQPTEKQPLLAPKKDEVSTKLNLIFKKCLWSNPPDNYHEKMPKWTHNGIARGFHGPDDLFCPGRYSHYG